MVCSVAIMIWVKSSKSDLASDKFADFFSERKKNPRCNKPDHFDVVDLKGM